MKYITAAMLIILLFVGGIARADSPAVLDAKQKMDAGQYADALQSIAKSLAATSKETDAVERYQLLMLKGEGLLHTGAFDLAAGAFDSAAYTATDNRDVIAARADALLVRASPTGKYRPDAVAEPIDIVNPESRKKAFAAMRQNLAKSVKPQLEKALASPTLQPMIDLLPSMLDLAHLDMALDGSVTTTKDDLLKLGVRARELMNTELRRVSIRMAVMENAANSWDGGFRRGLNSNERNDLRDTVTYLQRIDSTARTARRRAIELGFDGKAWEPIIADAGDLAERAKAILDFTP